MYESYYNHLIPTGHKEPTAHEEAKRRQTCEPRNTKTEDGLLERVWQEEEGGQ